VSDEELNEWVKELLEFGDETVVRDLAPVLKEEYGDNYDRNLLLRTLDENSELRDDNFVHPESVLVFVEATGTLEEVPVWELPFRFPLQGHGARWCHEDLGEVVEAKATLYRQSRAANDLAEDYPDATPECGTVVLVDPNRPGPLSWCVVKARVLPGQL